MDPRGPIKLNKKFCRNKEKPVCARAYEKNPNGFFFLGEESGEKQKKETNFITLILRIQSKNFYSQYSLPRVNLPNLREKSFSIVCEPWRDIQISRA